MTVVSAAALAAVPGAAAPGTPLAATGDGREPGDVEGTASLDVTRTRRNAHLWTLYLAAKSIAGTPRGATALLRAQANLDAWTERLTTARVQRPDWRKRGNCRGLDPTLMFPEHTCELATAVNTCQGCPVTLSCLASARAEEAWSHEPDTTTFGVRGGLTAAQRIRVYEQVGS